MFFFVVCQKSSQDKNSQVFTRVVTVIRSYREKRGVNAIQKTPQITNYYNYNSSFALDLPYYLPHMLHATDANIDNKKSLLWLK